MRKLVYYIGVSLDGYIAGPGGEVDFYPTPPEYVEWMMKEFPDSIPTHLRAHFGMDPELPAQHWDTVLMGRGTYVLPEGHIESPFSHLKQYVVSSSLDQSEHPGVEIFSGDPVELVRELKKEDGADIWLCGGGKLAGQLIDEIDEMVVKSYPVIAGSGVPVFTGVFKPTNFRPVRRQEFGNGTQVTWFERA
ncbi:dihydrofolate reductase family protein [Nocardia sp. JW2]|uniref:Dihydrofolate reductase n=1 Tax=Nocardia coubleae TaxID=356147 RepID=A0A846W994_9NOCA|nr:dihydrofolate reductase family protein [Nocardia coubleae]NKX89220.1 dihydrofolate reductase [Nocardia coubleae]